jgi:hypothetical protein
MDTRCRSVSVVVATALVVVLDLVAPAELAACSVCRCGDPAFNALGLDLFRPGAFNLALDWDRFEKEQGGDEGVEALVENRYTLTASYAVGRRVTLIARVPWSSRDLTTEPGEGGEVERVSADGLSDPELWVHYRLWAAPMTSAVGSRGWVGVHGGVKTPWGENERSEGGERLDEHVQPGTGSTDWVVGIAGVLVVDPSSTLFGSAQYRSTGTNSYGYRYGDSALATAGYERSFGSVLDGVVEADFRDADMDRVDDSGELDPNTGGSLLYLTPRLLVRLSSSFVARASAQIPVARDLNGDQTEHTVYSAGVTWVIGQ